jgi:thiol-disulfide isomerase/thioredoxin
MGFSNGFRISSVITTVLLTVLLLASVSFSASQKDVIHQFHMDEMNQAAPNFTFVDAQGHSVSLDSYRGKAVLLHFWASWCTPCQKELPELVQLAKQLDSKSWVFLPITVDEPSQRAKALKFLQGLKPQVPFFQLNDSKAAEKYKTWGLPVTYLISPSGEIIARALGRRDWLANPDAVNTLNLLFAASK